MLSLTVDALMVGAGDLRCSLGLEVGSQDGNGSTILDTLEKIQRAADVNDLAVFGFATTPEILGRRLERGWRAFIVHSESVPYSVSTGEKLSSKKLRALLQVRSILAKYADLSDAINIPVALPLDQDSYNRLAVRLGEVIQACPVRVAVVTGYFGRAPCGILNEIGCGCTDLCAALLAVGIPGAELEVWKELDGIFTADPGHMRTARLLRTISPAEAAELTFYSSEVIHPLAMKQAVRNRILIMVKGVMYQLSVDLMSTSEVQVSMALYSKAPQVVNGTGNSHELTCQDLCCAIQDVCHCGRVELVPDMAIGGIIGRQIRRTVGLVGDIFGTLGRNNIHVKMITLAA
ncbi:hypothetical protein DL768_004135 [Monosporascus sp. mg162]|nr:hypothetical protein DL768_004135 [Monosporascus sp. mg162]